MSEKTKIDWAAKTCPRCNQYKPLHCYNNNIASKDWLWDRIPVPVLARILDTMRVCDQVDWLLCTKRPEAWKERMYKVLDYIEDDAQQEDRTILFHWISIWLDGIAPKHIWIGTTVENRAMADKRIPELLAIPAAIHFLSCEPLLEDITPLPLFGINWVIPGGESGSLARPCNTQWIRNIKDQCAAANVACFVKQVGANPTVTKSCAGSPIPDDFRCYSHPKGGDPAEWPEDLRVRQWPESRR